MLRRIKQHSPAQSRPGPVNSTCRQRFQERPQVEIPDPIRV